LVGKTRPSASSNRADPGVATGETLPSPTKRTSSPVLPGRPARRPASSRESAPRRSGNRLPNRSQPTDHGPGRPAGPVRHGGRSGVSTAIVETGLGPAHRAFDEAERGGNSSRGLAHQGQTAPWNPPVGPGLRSDGQADAVRPPTHGHDYGSSMVGNHPSPLGGPARRRSGRTPLLGIEDREIDHLSGRRTGSTGPALTPRDVVRRARRFNGRIGRRPRADPNSTVPVT